MSSTGKQISSNKSSIEILSELFSTFDAEPPVMVKEEKYEDSSKKRKKTKKKKEKEHKHKKHKKKSKHHKKKRSRSSSSSSSSDSAGIDLTEILIKQNVDKPAAIKTEQNVVIRDKLVPEESKPANSIKSKNDGPKGDHDLNNKSESSSSENDSDDNSTAPIETKFSSIFHVALQTLQEREKLKREQLIKAHESANNNHKRKHLDEIQHDKKIKTETISEKLKSDHAADNKVNTVSKHNDNESTVRNNIHSSSKQSESKCSYDKSSSKSVKSSQDKRSDKLKPEDKIASVTSKRKISPIVFKTDDVSSDHSKQKESSKRAEIDSNRSRDKVHERDRDKDRHNDRHHRDVESHRRDGDVHRRDGDSRVSSHRREKDSHRRDGDSRHKDDKSSWHKHKDNERKHRSRDKSREDSDFYKKKDPRTTFLPKRVRSRSRTLERITGFSQGKLVSTRLGNPFYLRKRGDVEDLSGNPFYEIISRTSPPSLRSSGKEDRWSKRERFRRETMSSGSGGNGNGGGIGIDKKKLLEIARKNAVHMMKGGNLPDALKLGPQAQEKVLAAIRSGGKTVGELTDFCRNLSHKEEMGELSSLSDGETKSDGPDSDTEPTFNHPFQLKERPQSITMNIKNSVPLPIKSTAERATELHLQFPVSSGQLHRKTESEWTPVEPSPAPVLVGPQPKPQAKKDLGLAAFGTTKATPPITTAPIPATPTPPTAQPIPPPAHSILPPIPPLVTLPIVPVTTLIPPPPMPPFPIPVPQPPMPLLHHQHQPVPPPPLPPPLPPMMPPPSPPLGLMTMVMEQQPPVPGTGAEYRQAGSNDVVVGTGLNVFPTKEQIAEQQKLDVASIVAQRLTAMRKLQENPNDVQAISEIYKAQKEMNFWAECKQQFGQFTGSTGAQIMSQSELNSGYQAWARRDQLQTAAPVTGGMGMHLLQKMGWRPGEGLGKEKSGALEPLLLEVKLDKKGVVAKEETRGGRGPRNPNPNAGNTKVAPTTVKHVMKIMQGKHPVSLLSEFASKRKLSPPEYSLCFECGPDHKKNFVFKVTLNEVEYKANIACGNKKEAKALAAHVCLQQLGMLPHVPPPGGGQQGPM